MKEILLTFFRVKLLNNFSPSSSAGLGAFHTPCTNFVRSIKTDQKISRNSSRTEKIPSNNQQYKQMINSIKQSTVETDDKIQSINQQ